MASTTASVAVKLEADSRNFTRGLDAAKKAARSFKTELAAIKAPPLPDIGKQIGLMKKQKFESPFGKEWELGLRRGTDKLKVELDKQAALYQQANRRMLPAMNRTQMSGSRAPTASGGGQGGGKWGSTGGLAIGYNAVQDLVQGGPMAIANNIPQIIDLVSKSPALKLLGAAAVAAAAAYASTVLYKYGYDRTIGADKMAEGRYAANKNASAKRGRAAAEASGTAYGEYAGEQLVSGQEAIDRGIAEDDRRLGRVQEEIQLRRDLARAKIQSIEDPAKKAKAIAEEEKKQLIEVHEAQVRRNEEVLKSAGDAWDAASRRVDQIKEEIALYKKQTTAFTQADHERKAAMDAELKGAEDAKSRAKARAGSAFMERDSLRDQGRQIPMRGEIIDAGMQSELAQISRERGRKLLDKLFDSATRGMEALGKLAEEDARLKAKAKDRGKLEEQLNLAELNSGGKTRKARKLERKMNVDSARDKYKQAGFSDADAEAMAEREVSAGEGRGGRIKGAVSPNGGKDGESSLDYLKDGKKMGTPKTSNLDAYRAVPSLRERQRKKAPEETPETTSPVSKTDGTVVTLLKGILDAVLGNKGGSIKGAVSPNG